jgi:hypothetical protein
LSSFSFLKGVKIRGEDDDDLCDRCHLLFFKGQQWGEKKGHKKKHGTHL